MLSIGHRGVALTKGLAIRSYWMQQKARQVRLSLAAKRDAAALMEEAEAEATKQQHEKETQGSEAQAESSATTLRELKEIKKSVGPVSASPAEKLAPPRCSSSRSQCDKPLSTSSTSPGPSATAGAVSPLPSTVLHVDVSKEVQTFCQSSCAKPLGPINGGRGGDGEGGGGKSFKIHTAKEKKAKRKRKVVKEKMDKATTSKNQLLPAEAALPSRLAVPSIDTSVSTPATPVAAITPEADAIPTGVVLPSARDPTHANLDTVGPAPTNLPSTVSTKIAREEKRTMKKQPQSTGSTQSTPTEPAKNPNTFSTHSRSSASRTRTQDANYLEWMNEFKDYDDDAESDGGVALRLGAVAPQYAIARFQKQINEMICWAEPQPWPSKEEWDAGLRGFYAIGRTTNTRASLRGQHQNEMICWAEPQPWPSKEEWDAVLSGGRTGNARAADKSDCPSAELDNSLPKPTCSAPLFEFESLQGDAELETDNYRLNTEYRGPAGVPVSISIRTEFPSAEEHVPEGSLRLGAKGEAASEESGAGLETITTRVDARLGSMEFRVEVTFDHRAQLDSDSEDWEDAED